MFFFLFKGFHEVVHAVGYAIGPFIGSGLHVVSSALNLYIAHVQRTILSLLLLVLLLLLLL